MALFSLVGQSTKSERNTFTGKFIYMCGYVNIFKDFISSQKMDVLQKIWKQVSENYFFNKRPVAAQHAFFMQGYSITINSHTMHECGAFLVYIVICATHGERKMCKIEKRSVCAS